MNLTSSQTVGHYENFPVASLLCPAALRPAVMALYRFARTADDLADEGQHPAEQRLQALEKYRKTLLLGLPAAHHVRPHPPALPGPDWPEVFVPLWAMVQRHQLPIEPLLDLLSAFEQDARQTRAPSAGPWPADEPAAYRTRADVLDYCRRSANPVGRLLLHLYGVHDEKALQQSDAICTALQLTNFWQDLGTDLSRGRSYAPLEDCAPLGVHPHHLHEHPQACQTLLKSWVAWTHALFVQGYPLCRTLAQAQGPMAGLELRLVVQGGLAILEKIRAQNHDTLSRRPRLRAWDALPRLWRACLVPPTLPL